MNIEVSVDTSQFDRILSDFPAALATAQQNALKSVGAAIRSFATESFRNASKRPSPWAPRTSGGKHPLLIRTGNMRQTLAWRVAGLDTVAVGTSTPYAKYHQSGTKFMPARPFLPVMADGRLMPAAEDLVNHAVTTSYLQSLSNLTEH